MIGTIIYLFFIWIVAGYLARLLVPGRQDLGFWRTVLLGVIGSFVGGFIGYLIFSHDLSDEAQCRCAFGRAGERDRVPYDNFRVDAGEGRITPPGKIHAPPAFLARSMHKRMCRRGLNCMNTAMALPRHPDQGE